MENNKDLEIDESLYSRQLYVLGKEAMKRMMNSRILVIGLDGLGQEVVKNVCLTGVSKVTLFDNRPVTEEDLCTGFYFRRSDIGKPRDSSVLERFKSLNEYVSVDVATDVDNFEGHDVVVVCNEGYMEQIRLNNAARRYGSKFVGCQARGLFSQVFCDFGEDFVSVDRTGEIPATGMINDITEDGVMTLVEEQRHNLEDLDVIKIIHSEQDEAKYFMVKVISPTQVKLHSVDGGMFKNETAEFKPEKFKVTYGGDFEQQKKPLKMSFKPLEDAICDPSILSFNHEADERNVVVHRCFVALGEFASLNKQLTADAFFSFFMDKYKSDFGSEPLIRSFGKQSAGMVMPICSIIGGFVAQEVLKAVSSKFTPLHQFFYFDAMDTISEDPKEDEACGRYGPLMRSLGRENVERLSKLNIFMVGAGAIGCEHLKNMVMCGMGRNGKISVTDMDAIEQSNLNRQFLFKAKDVSKMKAEIAVREVASLNQDFLRISGREDDENIVEGSSTIDISGMTNGISSEASEQVNLVYYNLKVGKETEAVFSDRFFQSLDFVATALDNVDARLYVDSRCVLNRKFLVDAGTSGTKGNVQVVIPFRTESYGSSQDPSEKSIPLCTIKNFPYLIEHTIEWAMSEFRFKFHDQIISIRDHLSGERVVEESEEKNATDPNNETLGDIIDKTPTNAKECIKNAVLLFVKLFHTSIKDLLTAFPPDSQTKEGQPFWTPPKRPPRTISFSVNDDLHLLFVQSAANIFSFNFGVNEEISKDMVVDFLKKEMLVEEFNVSESPADVHEESTRPSINASALMPAVFEKDDDSNFHIDFIYAAANLRAQNYKIPQADRLYVKGIAGRIIPAIATTTSMVSGLAVLEMIKYTLGVDHTRHKNSFLNLALPFFANTDPVEPTKQSYEIENKKYTFTLWNRLEYKNAKLKTIMKAFEIQFKKKLTMVMIDNTLVYWDFDSKYTDNLDKMVSELAKKDPDEPFVALDVFTDDDRDTFPRIIVVLD